jgi:hypothetical protein
LPAIVVIEGCTIGLFTGGRTRASAVSVACGLAITRDWGKKRLLKIHPNNPQASNSSTLPTPKATLLAVVHLAVLRAEVLTYADCDMDGDIEAWAAPCCPVSAYPEA